MNCTKQYWTVPSIQGENVDCDYTYDNRVEVMELFVPASMYVKNAQTFSQIEKEDCRNLTDKYVLIIELMLFMSRELYNDSQSNSTLCFESIKNQDGSWAGYRIRLMAISRIKMGQLLHALFVHNHLQHYTIRNRNPQLKKLQTLMKQICENQTKLLEQGVGTESDASQSLVNLCQETLDLMENAALVTWVAEDNLPVLTTLQSTKQKNSMYHAHPFKDESQKTHLQAFEQCTLEKYLQAVETICGKKAGVRMSQNYICLHPMNHKDEFYPTQAFSVASSVFKVACDGNIDSQYATLTNYISKKNRSFHHNNRDHRAMQPQQVEVIDNDDDQQPSDDIILGLLDDMQRVNCSRTYEDTSNVNVRNNDIYDNDADDEENPQIYGNSANHDRHYFYKNSSNVYVVRPEYFNVYTYQDFVFPFAESFEMDNKKEQMMFFRDLQCLVDPDFDIHTVDEQCSDPLLQNHFRRIEAARLDGTNLTAHDDQDTSGQENMLSDEVLILDANNELGSANHNHRVKRRKLVSSKDWKMECKIQLSLKPNKSNLLTYYTLRDRQKKLFSEFAKLRQELEYRLRESLETHKDDPNEMPLQLYDTSKATVRYQLGQYRKRIQMEGLDYFKRIFHKDGMIPDAHRAIARWLFEYLEENDQKIGLTRRRGFKNLSISQDKDVVRLTDYEVILETFSCHRDMQLTYIAVLQNYCGEPFKCNILHCGDAGAGKSFLMNVFANNLIEGSVKSLTYSTLKSKTAGNTNHSAMIEIYQEAQPEMLGIPSNTKSGGGGGGSASGAGAKNITNNTGGESMIKTQLTDGFIMVQEMVWNENHERVLKETKVMTDILVFMGTNDSHNVPTSVVDRFVRVAWTEQLQRVSAQASLKSNPAMLDKCKQTFKTKLRRNQALACVLGSMMDIGIICKVDMHVAWAFYEKLQNECVRRHLPGFERMAIRNKQRYEMVVQGIVMDRAIDIVFDFLPTCDPQQDLFQQLHDQPFVFERMIDLEPHLYSRTEDCILAFGLIAQQFEDFSQYSVLEILKSNHFFGQVINKSNKMMQTSNFSNHYQPPHQQLQQQQQSFLDIPQHHYQRNGYQTPDKSSHINELITADLDLNQDLTKTSTQDVQQQRISAMLSESNDHDEIDEICRNIPMPIPDSIPTRHQLHSVNPGSMASPNYHQTTLRSNNWAQPSLDDFDEHCYVIDMKGMFKNAKSNRDEDKLLIFAQQINDKIKPRPKFEETYNVIKKFHTTIVDYEVVRVNREGVSETQIVHRAILSFNDDNVVILKSVFDSCSKEQLKEIITAVAHYKGAPTQTYLYGRTHLESPMLWQHIEVDTVKWVQELKRPLSTFKIRNPEYFDRNLLNVFGSDKPNLNMSFSDKVYIQFKDTSIDDWGMLMHHQNICLDNETFLKPPSSSASHWRLDKSSMFERTYPNSCQIDNQYMAKNLGVKSSKNQFSSRLSPFETEKASGDDDDSQYESLEDLAKEKFIEYRSPETLRRERQINAYEDEDEDYNDETNVNQSHDQIMQDSTTMSINDSPITQPETSKHFEF